MGRTNSQGSRSPATPKKEAGRRKTAINAKKVATGQTNVASARKKGERTSLSVDCPVCKKVIGRSADLPRHMRLHLPRHEVVTQCPIEGCTFATIQKSNLATHVRTHSRDTPLKCPYDGCDFENRDPASLTRHKKNQHGYVPSYKSHGGRSRPNKVPRQALPKFEASAPTGSTSTSSQSSPSTSMAPLPRVTPFGSEPEPEPEFPTLFPNPGSSETLQGQYSQSSGMNMPPPAWSSQPAGDFSNQVNYNEAGQLGGLALSANQGVYQNPMNAGLPLGLENGYYAPPMTSNPYLLSSEESFMSRMINAEVNSTMVSPCSSSNAVVAEMGQPDLSLRVQDKIHMGATASMEDTSSAPNTGIEFSPLYREWSSEESDNSLNGSPVNFSPRRGFMRKVREKERVVS